MGKNLILFIFVMFLIPLVSADTVNDTTEIQAGADMIAAGNELDRFKIAYEFFSFGDTVSKQITTTGKGFLLSMLMIDYNPLTDPFVQTNMLKSALLCFFAFVTILLLGMGYVAIYESSKDFSKGLEEITFRGHTFNAKEYLNTILIGIALVLFGYIGIEMLMLGSNITLEILTVNVLDTLTISMESSVMALIMGMAYFALMIAVFWSIIVKGLLTSYFWIVVILWMIPQTRVLAVSILWYLVAMIFMRPILVLIANGGISIIAGVTSSYTLIPAAFGYLALMGLLILVALCLIIYPVFFYAIYLIRMLVKL